MAATLVVGPNTQVAKNTVLFANMPGFVDKVIKVYRTESGVYQSYDKSYFSDFNGVEAGRSYTFIMATGGTFDDLGVGGGGNPGPLVTIPVTASATNFTITGVTLKATDLIYRSNGSPLQASAYSLTVTNGNSTITIPTGDPAITQAEAENQPSLQYQIT